MLSQAAEIVDKTEPNTNAWYAIQLSKSKFAIFDAFKDANGQQAHFQGKVASLLKSKSNDLIKGGWDNGVVKNINSFRVISHK